MQPQLEEPGTAEHDADGSAADTMPTFDQLAAEVQSLQAQLAQAQMKAAHLEIALTTSRQIGAAIGVLMSAHHVGYDAAFDLMRRASQARHVKLRDIADEVIYTGTITP